MKRLLTLVAAVLIFTPTPGAKQADSSALTTRLQGLVDQWRTSNNVPGVSVGIVQKDGRVQSLTSGVADRPSGRPLAPSDLLMTGSTGKTFFAAVALQLIEAGRLDLNAPISKYLSRKPWFN